MLSRSRIAMRLGRSLAFPLRREPPLPFSSSGTSILTFPSLSHFHRSHEPLFASFFAFRFAHPVQYSRRWLGLNLSKLFRAFAFFFSAALK